MIRIIVKEGTRELVRRHRAAATGEPCSGR